MQPASGEEGLFAFFGCRNQQFNQPMPHAFLFSGVESSYDARSRHAAHHIEHRECWKGVFPQLLWQPRLTHGRLPRSPLWPHRAVSEQLLR